MAETQEVKIPPSHASVFEKMDQLEHPNAPMKATGVNTPPAEPAKPEATPAPQAVAAAAEAAKPETTEAPVLDPDMDEATFLKLYKKMTGKEVSSLDALKEPPTPPTAEELAKLAVKEQNESLEWALGTEKITRELYEKSIVERAKSKRDIALAIFAADLRLDDKTLTNEECEEKFTEFYCETEPEDSWKRKRALAQMNGVADNYLSQYNTVDGIGEEYKSYKASAAQQKVYAKQIKAIAQELPKEIPFEYEYKTIDGRTLSLKAKIPVDDKVISKLVAEFSAPGMEKVFGGDETTPKKINAELAYHLNARVIKEGLPAVFELFASQIDTDIWATVKNARNSNQTFGQPSIDAKTPKTPPSHKEVFDKLPK